MDQPPVHHVTRLIAIPVILLSILLIFLAAEIGVAMNHSQACIADPQLHCYPDWYCTDHNEKGSDINISMSGSWKTLKKEGVCTDPDIKPGSSTAYYPVPPPPSGLVNKTPSNDTINTAAGDTFKGWGFCINSNTPRGSQPTPAASQTPASS